MTNPAALNHYLVLNNVRIKDNPAVSPDLTLDPAALAKSLRMVEKEVLAAIGTDPEDSWRVHAGNISFFPRSRLPIGEVTLFLIEDEMTGDSALVCLNGAEGGFEDVIPLSMLSMIPLTWSNLIRLKNLIYQHRPGVINKLSRN